MEEAWEAVLVCSSNSNQLPMLVGQLITGQSGEKERERERESPPFGVISEGALMNLY